MSPKITFAVLLFYYLSGFVRSGTDITLLVAVDQVQNDSVIATVERTIGIINSNNDTLPEYLLQYTTDKQVCTVQLILDMIVYVVA